LAIRLSVDQMIATFGSTYRTIDLRSAVVKQGSVWTNVYTVIRFTYEEPEAAKRRLLDLEAKHGVIATKSFQVRLDSLPFSQWSALCQGLSTKGHIGEIAFRQTFGSTSLERPLFFVTTIPQFAPSIPVSGPSRNFQSIPTGCKHSLQTP